MMRGICAINFQRIILVVVLCVSPSRGDCNKPRFVFRKNFPFLRASCRLKRTCASNFQIEKKLYHRRNIKFYVPIVLFTTLCYFSKVHYHLNRLSLNYSCSLLPFFLDALKPFLSYNIWRWIYIVVSHDISQKDALVALFVFRLISNRLKFKSRSSLKILAKVWFSVSLPFVSIQISFFSQNARDAQTTE